MLKFHIHSLFTILISFHTNATMDTPSTSDPVDPDCLLLTQDFERVGVRLGGAQGVVGGVAREAHVPLQGRHRQAHAGHRVPAPRACPLLPGRGAGEGR